MEKEELGELTENIRKPDQSPPLYSNSMGEHPPWNKSGRNHTEDFQYEKNSCLLATIVIAPKPAKQKC